jgi:carboxypeptidase Taq
MSANGTLEQLRIRLAEITDLHKTGSLLFWDQRTKMPPAGAEARAEALATVGRIAHQKFVDPELGRLLEELRPVEDGLDPASFEASLIRVARHDFEKALRVPPDLTAEIRRAGALGLMCWQEARQKKDFSLLMPSLDRNLELKHRYVECFPRGAETYDTLLDDYEQGMTTAEVRAVFEELKRELLPLVRASAGEPPSQEYELPRQGQERFARAVLERLGFDDASWRLDETVHPFMSTAGHGDIRLTTRWEAGMNWLFGAIHEFGHGVYEHDIDSSLARTPLGTGVSLGLHESQSRTWENLVGRSRPFWQFFFPQLQEAFPEHLGSTSEEDFYRSVNHVEPSLIRVDADEVTYNFHIILRFELEQELIEGRVSIAEMPAWFDAKMDEYLGITPPDPALGVMQDMHWAGGSIGYFPTYALGNVMSVQIFERARQDLPDLDEQFARGEFAPLRDWFRANLYVHGRKFTPQETLERASGSRLDAAPYVRYLKSKYAAA